MISGFLIMLRYSDTMLSEPGATGASSSGGWRGSIRSICHLAVLRRRRTGGAFRRRDQQRPGRYDFAVLPANILLVQGWGVTEVLTYNYVGWTLSAEWFCYLALLAFVARSSCGKRGLVALVAVSIVLLEAASRSGLVPFTTGCRRIHGAPTGRWPISASARCGVATAGFNRQPPAWWRDGPRGRGDADGATCLSGPVAACRRRFTRRSVNPTTVWIRLASPLGPLGQVSFGIYLIHPVIETLAFSLAWRKHVESRE